MNKKIKLDVTKIEAIRALTLFTEVITLFILNKIS